MPRRGTLGSLNRGHRLAWKTLSVVAVVGVISTVTAVASAEDPTGPTVVLVPSSLEADARGALGGRADVQIEVVPTASERVSGRALLEAPRGAYTAMDFERARVDARAAQVALEERAESRVDFAEVADAWLLSGMAELALGDRAKATEAFRTAVIILPGRTLPEDSYAPPVRELYDSVRAAVRAAPPATVELAVSPAGAGVFLDGNRVGVGSTTIEGVPGRHQVRVEAVGYQSRRLTVQLAADGGAPISVELPMASREEVIVQLRDLTTAELSTEERTAVLTVFGASSVIAARPQDASVSFVAVEFGRARRGRAPDVARILSDGGDGAEAVVATPGSADPYDGPRHTGFYARLWGGLSLKLDHARLDMVDADVLIPAADLELGAGVNVIEGLIVGGSFFFSLGEGSLNVTCPPGAMDPGCNTASPSSHFVGALKVFVDFYPFKRGFHVGLGLGVSRSQLSDGFALLPDTIMWGGYLDVALGWDFWVTDFATAGVAIRAAGWRGTKDEMLLNGGVLSLLATVSYD